MPRKEVEIFSLCMEEKLRQNDHKGGWEDCTYADLFARLRAEIDELEQAIKNEPEVNIMYEGADVANFAMMIAWNAIRGVKNGGKNRNPIQREVAFNTGENKVPTRNSVLGMDGMG